MGTTSCGSPAQRDLAFPDHEVSRLVICFLCQSFSSSACCQSTVFAPEGCSESINQSINQPTNQSINQWINRSMSLSISQSINQPINQSNNLCKICGGYVKSVMYEHVHERYCPTPNTVPVTYSLASVALRETWRLCEVSNVWTYTWTTLPATSLLYKRSVCINVCYIGYI